MTASLARRERLGLVETARSVGPTAPTLCGDWTVLDLICHLIVRERQPWAMPGILIPRLSGITGRAMAALAKRPFPNLLETVAHPPLLVAPDAVERLMNTLEMFVHHEDVRRAQPSWSARTLSREDEAQLWQAVRTAGKMLVRPAGVPVVITDGVTTATLRGGADPVTVKGPVSELALFLYGRRQLEPLEYDGPETRVAALKSAKLGF